MVKKSTPLEKLVEDYLVLSAENRGGLALKLRPPKGRGFPDRTLLLPHTWVALVEVKRPEGGVVAKHQTSWGADLTKAGQRFFIVSTFEEVDALFRIYEKDIQFDQG